ncbi:unnamed protein product [Cochlearia groenlandica]
MGSTGNTNPWGPYDSYRDCSQGLCSVYCPQWCYIIFPPPPPSFFLDDDSSSSSSSSSDFSPLLIALIGILSIAFILVTYYTLLSKYCHRRRILPSSTSRSLNGGDSHISSSFSVNDPWQGNNVAAASNDGLDESLIKSITVYKFRKGDGFVESSDCSVCLSEFEDNERLRLLPKCKHAFHVSCIDTWLKSHSNCPLCRTFIAVESAAVVNNQIATESNNGVSGIAGFETISNDLNHRSGDSFVFNLDLETRSRSETVGNGGSMQKPPEQPGSRDGDDEVNRRSEAINSGGVVLIADILREIEDDDDDQGGDEETSDVGTSRGLEDCEGEKTPPPSELTANLSSGGISSFLERSSMAMKRSVSTGRFIHSSYYDRAQNYRLPS